MSATRLLTAATLAALLSSGAAFAATQTEAPAAPATEQSAPAQDVVSPNEGAPATQGDATDVSAQEPAAPADAAEPADPAMAPDPAAAPAAQDQAAPASAAAPAAGGEGKAITTPDGRQVILQSSPTPPDQAYRLKAGDPNVVSNAPVPDTAENRAAFGGPKSATGKKSGAKGN